MGRRPPGDFHIGCEQHPHIPLEHGNIEGPTLDLHRPPPLLGRLPHHRPQGQLQRSATGRQFDRHITAPGSPRHAPRQLSVDHRALELQPRRQGEGHVGPAMVLDVKPRFVLGGTGGMAPHGGLLPPGPGPGILASTAPARHQFRRRHEVAGVGPSGVVGKFGDGRVGLIGHLVAGRQFVEAMIDDPGPKSARLANRHGALLFRGAVDPGQGNRHGAREGDRAGGTNGHRLPGRGCQFDHP